jgi:very-short-patch-repair endonuclease
MTLVGETLVSYLLILSANWARAQRRGIEESPVSPAEVALLEALLAEDLEPECQGEVGPYDADFLFRDEGLCIEVDGKQHLDVAKRDLRRDDHLRLCGIKTLRFRAQDVFADASACVEVIRDALAAPRFAPAGDVEVEPPDVDTVCEVADDVLSARGMLVLDSETDRPSIGTGDAPDVASKPITDGISLFRAVIEETVDRAAYLGPIDPVVFKAVLRRWYEREALPRLRRSRTSKEN